MNESLLQIHGLSVEFRSPEGPARAVDEVSLEIARGETLGLVGESGCGKSVTALSVMGLLSSPPARVASGQIMFLGRDLLRYDPEARRNVRGRDMAMIFQEPMTSLNPVLTIGRQVAEPLQAHSRMTWKAAREEAAQWLDHVKIPEARRRLDDYPYQMSGGMRQRVMIAMAMVCRPKLLIADEPTTALDVTIQAQILSLMLKLKEELDMSMLLITHDLGVVAQMAGRVAVMYAGQVVEQGPTTNIFDQPAHPYTRGLLRSIPRLGARGNAPGRLAEIPGTVPPLTKIIRGCKFAQRCRHQFDRCQESRPEMMAIEPDHFARCWLVEYPERRKHHS